MRILGIILGIGFLTYMGVLTAFDAIDSYRRRGEKK